MKGKSFLTRSRRLKALLIVAGITLVLGAPFASAQWARQNKQNVMRQVAQKWIAVGREQYKRGSYIQAEQSLLYALDYQQHLDARQHRMLKELLEKVRVAVTERMNIQRQIDTAEQLLMKQNLSEAGRILEKIRSNPSAGKDQLQQVKKALATIKNKLKEHQQQIAKLYNQGMKLYEKGKFEQARENFARIDAVLEKIIRPSAQQPAAEFTQQDLQDTSEDISGTTSIAAEQPHLDKQSLAQLFKQQPQETDTTKILEQLDRSGPAEALKPEQKKQPLDRKDKLMRSYIKAVVNDAVTKSQDYEAAGQPEKALRELELAKQLISQNRHYLDEETFTRFNAQLQDSAESIVNQLPKKSKR